MALVGFDCVWISSVEFVVTLGWREGAGCGQGCWSPTQGLGGRGCDRVVSA